MPPPPPPPPPPDIRVFLANGALPLFVIHPFSGKNRIFKMALLSGWTPAALLLLLCSLGGNPSCAAFSVPLASTGTRHAGGLYASTLKDAGDVVGSREEERNNGETAVNGFAPPVEAEEDDAPELAELTEEEKAEKERDMKYMQMAIQQANSRGGERGARSPFPKPIVGAVIATPDGRIIGKGRASYKKDAVRAAIADAGIVATPLREWCVTWPHDEKLRKDIAESTLYVTLEPSTERQG